MKRFFAKFRNRNKDKCEQQLARCQRILIDQELIIKNLKRQNKILKQIIKNKPLN